MPEQESEREQVMAFDSGIRHGRQIVFNLRHKSGMFPLELDNLETGVARDPGEGPGGARMSDLNPTWEDCGCGWGRRAWTEGLEMQERVERPGRFMYGIGYDSLDHGEMMHDMLLGLDGPHLWPSFVRLMARLQDCIVPAD